MNQLLGNLTYYGTTFKADKCREEKEGTCSCSDEEETKFVTIFEKFTYEYKGKIPFKCFNYGRVGHYASKCTHKKIEYQSRGKEKTNFSNRLKGNIFNRRTLYA